MSKLFVGNVSWDATEDDIRKLFETAGEVVEVILIMDRERNRHKGFGFVTMGSEEEADNAIETLNEKELLGRPIVVNKAREREERN